ncbi:murein hydrolase activator EnvC family protein [Streptomyces cyslabdanicus]|uniref:murein hydrolase activator EnvC family protein n=1 Tax=Streptomyces cyslabdanicus TaxID=1470456 RepID=UPI004044E081
MRWTAAGFRREPLPGRAAARVASTVLVALVALVPSAAPVGSGGRTAWTAWTASSARADGDRAVPVDSGPDPGPGPGPGSGEGDPPVPAVGRVWPVGVRPEVLRGWNPPATVYGPGHRGVDLGASPGAPVRAVAAGRVFFAGPVADRGVVSVELAGTGEPPLRTTYEPVRASVKQGDEVAAGAVVGTVEATGRHCEGPCVHWGLLRGRTYLNPLLLLPPWLLNGPTRLLPVLGVPQPRHSDRRAS